MIGISDELPWGGSQTATNVLEWGSRRYVPGKLGRTSKSLDIPWGYLQRKYEDRTNQIYRYHDIEDTEISCGLMIVIPKHAKFTKHFGLVWVGELLFHLYIYMYIHTYVCINQNHGGFDSRFARSSLHLYFETLEFKHKSWCRAKHGRMDPENVPKQRHFRAVFQNQTRTLLSQHPQC